MKIGISSRILALALSACPLYSAGAASSPALTGTYAGNLTCATSNSSLDSEDPFIGQQSPFLLKVKKKGSSYTLVDHENFPFVLKSVKKDSFTAIGLFVDQFECDVDMSYKFSRINAKKASVRYLELTQCSDGSSRQIEFKGELKRR